MDSYPYILNIVIEGFMFSCLLHFFSFRFFFLLCKNFISNTIKTFDKIYMRNITRYYLTLDSFH